MNDTVIRPSIVISSVVAFFVLSFVITGISFNLGVTQGRDLERTDIMSTPVMVGNPNNPNCSVEVTIGTLAEMAEIGVYSWVAACEEATE